LRRVLVPIDHAPAPSASLIAIGELMESLLVTICVVVEMILKTAVEIDADLIAMPTAGHHGILDAMRGSTTERVLRHAPCPVLATPAN
jgi:nucleotide-binding universal stress UspA family protein